MILYSNWSAAQVASTCCWCWMCLVPSPTQIAFWERCASDSNTFLKLEDRAQKLTGKRATFHEHLQSLRDDPYSSFSSIAAPLELSHENASLPQVRERVRLDGHYIHPELAAIYPEPSVFDRPLEELPTQSPVACSRVEHWASLAGRMYDISMLELMLPSTTPCLAGRAATSQFFGVAKKDSQLLRVILDRRP